jgi:hypothetical protein
MAMEMLQLVLLVLTSRDLVGRYQRLMSQAEGNVFLRNVGIYLQVHSAIQHRRPTPINIKSL